jgi:alpha-D-xyloside xylohydrolase
MIKLDKSSRSFLYYTIILWFISIGCKAGTFQKLDNGILIRLEQKSPSDPAQIKIQVCTPAVLRVLAVNEDEFSNRPSLIVPEMVRQAAQFVVEQQGDTAILSTSKITAKISLTTGQISYYDSAENLILSEKSGGGKIFTPAEVMGEQTRHIQQIFQSPDDEAFYGLGGHQNGIVNYKGHTIDLKQYNIVDSVPFLVSSRNYGILWDNNSRTKFGDIRDFQPLSSSLTLFGKDGKQGGLTADYYKDAEYKILFVSRVESVIDYESLQDQDKYPQGYKPDWAASIRWTGHIRPNTSGEHIFRLYSSNYAKLWLDGKLVVDSWRQNWCPWERIMKLNLEAGKKYSVKLEWIPNGGYIGLNHLDPEPAQTAGALSLYSEVADQIDYYFIYGQNADEVISGYRSITGKAPMMPKWAMGLWQCRERYKPQDELVDTVKEFRKRGIPLDNIVQDWFYWPENKWGEHDFDASRFPDPSGMVKQLHDELNTHIMISVWPKFYVGTEHYKQFEQNGWLYPRNVEKKERDWVGPGYFSTFYDPYSEGARELFWRQINAKLFSRGFDAWWLDATEPDIHSNLDDEEYLLRIGPTALGTSARYRNTFSLMNARGIYEGQRSVADRRVFILTRSAYAGQQRYSAATWSGDIAARWYDLKTQIATGLNFCLSGIPYWTTDIGGFAVEPRFERDVKPQDLDEWRQLQTRWFQFGTFCPLFRVHGQLPYREIFHIAPDEHPAYQTMLAYDQLRYRLMPYIYSLTAKVTHEDYTIMRALVMDFGGDPGVLNIDDQFMFGPSLLICPVTEYNVTQRPVYLPASNGWYELKTGRYHDGRRTMEADAPYSDIPIFVKAGSILPFGPPLQYFDEKPADPIRLYVYTGQSGSFTLYEDENTNYNYEKGMYSRIELEYDQAAKTLTIADRTGEFPGMLNKRTFEVVWIESGVERKLDFDEKPDTIVVYEGRKTVVSK